MVLILAPMVQEPRVARVVVVVLTIQIMLVVQHLPPIKVMQVVPQQRATLVQVVVVVVLVPLAQMVSVLLERLAEMVGQHQLLVLQLLMLAVAVVLVVRLALAVLAAAVVAVIQAVVRQRREQPILAAAAVLV